MKVQINKSQGDRGYLDEVFGYFCVKYGRQIGVYKWSMVIVMICIILSI